MPCIILLLLLGLPRLALFATWLFTDYITRAFGGPILLPLLGFLFAPLTTLAWAWAKNTYGTVEGLGLAAVILAALLDFGLIGASRRKRAA
jgi:hypothetical protein